MSYFPCRYCGKMIGVIGTTIYSCGCKPTLGMPDSELIDKAVLNKGTPKNVEEWAKKISEEIQDMSD